jgi:hypothetical protein
MQQLKANLDSFLKILIQQIQSDKMIILQLQFD